MASLLKVMFYDNFVEAKGHQVYSYSGISIKAKLKGSGVKLLPTQFMLAQCLLLSWGLWAPLSLSRLADLHCLTGLEPQNFDLHLVVLNVVCPIACFISLSHGLDKIF